jgi:hypothetical protein
MKPSSKLSLSLILIVAAMLSSCGIHTEQLPRDIDPSRQSELNGK